MSQSASVSWVLGSTWQGEKALQVGGGDGCAAMWVCLIP